MFYYHFFPIFYNSIIKEINFSEKFHLYFPLDVSFIIKFLIEHNLLLLLNKGLKPLSFGTFFTKV